MNIDNNKNNPIIAPATPAPQETTPALKENSETKSPPDKSVNETHPPSVVDNSNQCTVIDKPKYNTRLNYELAKNDYVLNRLKPYQIRDKYGLNRSQYCRLRLKVVGWKKEKEKAQNKIVARTEQIVAINNAKTLNNIADTIDKLARLVMLKEDNGLIKTSQEGISIKNYDKAVESMNTLAKLHQLLTGNATENVTIEQRRKDILHIVQSLKR